MAEVKIIDIDGVQWEMKDQTARDKITALEKEIISLKTVEKWETTIPNYGGKIIARRQGNIVNVVGSNIGRENKIPSTTGDINFATLPERFRPSGACFFMIRVSGSYHTSYGGMVYPTGKINCWTYTDIDYGFFSLSYIVD